ncbi:hypothetical protein LINPERPRIM_LOCUS24146 [Linum perenne]
MGPPRFRCATLIFDVKYNINLIIIHTNR